MARRCVRSRNLENEEAKARYRAVKIQPQWVVTSRKKQTKETYLVVRVVTLSDSKSLPYPAGTATRVSAANMNITVLSCVATAQVRPRPPHC